MCVFVDKPSWNLSPNNCLRVLSNFDFTVLSAPKYPILYQSMPNDVRQWDILIKNPVNPLDPQWIASLSFDPSITSQPHFYVTVLDYKE